MGFPRKFGASATRHRSDCTDRSSCSGACPGRGRISHLWRPRPARRGCPAGFCDLLRPGYALASRRLFPDCRTECNCRAHCRNPSSGGYRSQHRCSRVALGTAAGNCRRRPSGRRALSLRTIPHTMAGGNGAPACIVCPHEQSEGRHSSQLAIRHRGLSRHAFAGFQNGPCSGDLRVSAPARHTRRTTGSLVCHWSSRWHPATRHSRARRLTRSGDSERLR